MAAAEAKSVSYSMSRSWAAPLVDDQASRTVATRPSLSWTIVRCSATPAAAKLEQESAVAGKVSGPGLQTTSGVVSWIVRSPLAGSSAASTVTLWMPGTSVLPEFATAQADRDPHGVYAGWPS